MSRAAALAAAGVSLPEWMTAQAGHAGMVMPSAGQASAAPVDAPLDIAEWSYFWVGVERAHLARGTMVNGQQMYVEYWIPNQLRHPYPIVLVHGGGGQGTDWLGTPDGRPGWATYLLQEGYKVYVVDRPGHGRSPFHPDLHGSFPPQSTTLEGMSGQFTPPNAMKPAVGPYRPLHNQWPGTGEVGSHDLDQFVASQGGAYFTPGGPGGATVIEDGGRSGGAETAHMVWRQRGAMLLDKIGPAIIMTHSAGGPFGWLAAEIRPNLVKAIVAIEGGGSRSAGRTSGVFRAFRSRTIRRCRIRPRSRPSWSRRLSRE